ncbi:MAG: phosphatidylserine/phosphatidylglycerophosphate/cardiolipin synthase family protein [Bdellovibrionales bacterium]|nr:phosphatidylserine/phosphatidylglycerophosphate/cardiolipin synthase family protein [Bdellovibrionales bacterium]
MEKILENGEEFKQELLSLISKASETIQVSTYIIDNSSLSDEILKLLIEKANNGIKVDLLVDGIGSRKWLNNRPQNLPDNFKLAVFHPLPWPLGHSWPDFHSLFLINRRNHHKIIIVDRKQAIVGSRNICEDSLKWREISVLIDGLRVIELIKVFEWTWLHCMGISFKKLPSFKKFKLQNKSVYTNTNVFERIRRYRELHDQFKDCKEHIFITTPYFLPPIRIFNLLNEKAKEGKDVRLLLPQKTDIKVSQWIARAHYKIMLKNGVKIYEYKPEVLHAKTLIVDNWILVGSSNFNRRSFERDLEVDIVLEKIENIAELKAKYFYDLESSSHLISTQYRGPALLIKILVMIFLLFGGWF